MKGIVFTELVEMVEGTFGLEAADRMIVASDLPSRGCYTAVGTYDHGEILTLVAALSQAIGVAVPELVRAFGRHLFGRFAVLYPRFFAGVTSPVAFLASVGDCIHIEVRKLYPDAELPHFRVQRQEADSIELLYESPRPFAEFAHGLFEGCAAHFGVRFSIEREDLPAEHGQRVRFALTVEQPVSA